MKKIIIIVYFLIIFLTLTKDVFAKNCADVLWQEVEYQPIIGGGGSFVAVDEESFGELRAAMYTNALEEMKFMMLDRRIFFVDRGTKVLVLKCEIFKGMAKLQILGGENYGRSGWIPVEDIGVK